MFDPLNEWRPVVWGVSLVVIAGLLFRVLPPGSTYRRLMMRSWAVKPPEGFGQAGRLDYVRSAAKVASAGIILFVVGFWVFGKLLEETRADTPVGFFAQLGLLTTALVGAMCVLSGPILLGRAFFWRAWPPLPYLVLSGDVEVGETNLDHRALEHGIVGGGLRPTRGFAEVIDSIESLSVALSRYSTPAQRRQAVKEFSASGGWRVLARSGTEVSAHEVCVVDLARVGVGYGYWVEVSVRDTSAWSPNPP